MWWSGFASEAEHLYQTVIDYQLHKAGTRDEALH
ncbi:hypothetical protein ACVWZT_001976 [Pseudomonas sp. TE21394]